MKDEFWNKRAQEYGVPTLEELLHLWYEKENRSVLSIAVNLDTTAPTIRAMMKRFGIVPRPPKECPKIPKKELMKLPSVELALRYKVSHATVYRQKKALGLTKGIRRDT